MGADGVEQEGREVEGVEGLVVVAAGECSAA